MKRFLKGTFVFLMISMAAGSNPVLADSLSAALGATKLDGLTHFANCQNESIGYRENLIADRLELKLANTPNVTPEERRLWTAEIAALRQSWQTHTGYKPPDSKNPQHYMLGLSDKEQVAINSMNNRYLKEINIKCEDRYGGMSQWSGQGKTAIQADYEAQLRSEMMQQQVIHIDSVPVEPFVKEKTQQEREQERRANYKAMQQEAMGKFNQCTQNAKGLRPKIIAQTLQRKLDNGAGLSAKEREELQADIQAAWMSAGKGLDQIQSADPSQPYRAEMRLTPQDQMEVNTEYSKQYLQMVQSCTAVQRPPMPMS